MPTETTLNSLKVHKVPDFETWEENYNQTNGIGTSDVVVIPPEELKKGVLPDQTNNSGKFLTTDGNGNTSWATVDALPNQSGNSGKYLKTNGSAASWENAPVTSVNSKTGAVSLSASDVSAVATSAVGANSGVAPLNASGKIDSTYLPSYVDDVIEGYYYNSKFYTTSAHTTEITGETGKIFVDLTTNKTYRYGGSSFTEISQGSIVSVSRDLTSGTKIGTLTINGTGTDLYAPTPETFTVTGGASTIVSDNLTANRALISNTNGKVAVSDVTSTELGYLDGVTSAIQTQINGKQAKVTASGILKGDGSGGVSAATAGTDYPPVNHASTATTYGVGTSSNYGHVKLSDSTSSTSSTSDGIAATPAAVKAAYDLTIARTKIYTATCSTGASTAAKVATLDDSTGFSLAAGVKVAVTFTYGNSATTPTLNVNSSGAKTIAIPSSATAYTTGNGTTYNTWGAYETVLFTYTGTYWTHDTSGYLGYLAYNTASGRQAKITASGILKGDGSGGVTAAVAGTDYQAPLPSQSGNSGKYLTTNGSALSWETPPLGVYYGECSTAAATQAKTVTITDFPTTLTAGLSVRIKFTNGQTYAGTPTLQVNSTGAKSIYRSSSAGDQYMWYTGEVLDFVYDGTNWVAINEAVASTYYYGVTKLSSSTSSTSTSLAATPSAVKAAYDLANGKQASITASGILKGDGSGTVSAAVAGTDYQAPLPSQSGNSGKFLSTNGSTLSWDSQIFIATSSTTNAQIDAAVEDGKICFYDSSYGVYLPLVGRYENPDGELIHTFLGSIDNGYFIYEFCTDDSWSGTNFYAASTSSPTFYGTPKAPTAAAGTNTTQIATTAFVQNTMNAKITYGDTDLTAGTSPLANGVIYLMYEVDN